MRTFIWFSLITSILGVLVRAVLISISDYPRTIKYTRGEDMVFLLISVGMAIWGAYLLMP